MEKVKVRRPYFDGYVQIYGVQVGDALEFEVPADRAHFFVEFGYEIVQEEPKRRKKHDEGNSE